MHRESDVKSRLWLLDMQLSAEKKLQKFGNYSAVFIKQEKEILAHKPQATSTAFERVSAILKPALRECCCVCDVRFQKLVDILEADGVSPKVYPFLPDSTYNIRR